MFEDVIKVNELLNTIIKYELLILLNTISNINTLNYLSEILLL